MISTIQKITCKKCGKVFSESVKERDELMHIDSIIKMLRHFGVKGHKPRIIAFKWPKKR